MLAWTEPRMRSSQQPSTTFYDYILGKSHSQTQMHKLCLKTYILCEYKEGNNKFLAEV